MDKAMDFTELSAHINLPLNVVIRIFSFVSRDDLENCKLVCSTWKNVIIYADSQKHSELQKRPLDALILSTNLEYSITIFYKRTKHQYFYKKYFMDRDIDEMEEKRRKTANFDGNTYRFPCGERYPFRLSTKTNFKPADPFHHEQCKADVDTMLYRHNRQYTRKLFTPPLSFYERLARMLQKCKPKRVIFLGFTFTNLFVEKLFEYARTPFANVGALVLHCCNLRYISPEAFHALLGGIVADHYFLAHLRNCVPHHISAPLLDQLSIKRARTFYVGAALTRLTHLPITFSIDDDDFLAFTKSVEALVGQQQQPREFFGISNCLVTQRSLRIYEKMAICPNQSRNLYRHVLFADIRYLDEQLKKMPH